MERVHAIDRLKFHVASRGEACGLVAGALRLPSSERGQGRDIRRHNPAAFEVQGCIIMKSVDVGSLGRRIVELLHLGSEAVVEVQVLRDGSLRIMKGVKNE